MKENTELMQKYKRKADRILSANTSAYLRVTPFDFDIKNSIIAEKLKKSEEVVSLWQVYSTNK